MSRSKLISSCYMKFLKTLNPIRPLPIDKTSLTRSMSSAIHETFENKKKKVFREPKELVGQYEALSGSVQRTPNGAFPRDRNRHTPKRGHTFGNIFSLQFITKTEQLDKLAGVKKHPQS